MNVKTVLILLAMAVVLFFIGRFTAPGEKKDYKAQIDSIKLAYKDIDIQLKKNKDSILFYKTQANDLSMKADKEQKVKIIYKVQYEKDTANYHHLSLASRDSVIRAIFLH